MVGYGAVRTSAVSHKNYMFSSSCLQRQASSVLSHWITEYIHVFCPYGASLRLFKSAPGRFVRKQLTVTNMPG